MGQAQLEIPQVDPADLDAQAEAESARLDQELTEEQRRIETLEEQTQEQIEMIGPRGGILNPTKPTTRRRSANTEEKTANESATKAKDDSPDSRPETAVRLTQHEGGQDVA